MAAAAAEVAKGNAANRQESIAFAERLYQDVVLDVTFAAQEPHLRFETLVKRYPNFAQCYPIVLKYMALHGQFNRRAFERFLDRLAECPGKGMEGYMDCQARYVGFLYQEECRLRGKRPVASEEKRLRRAELEIMDKQYRAMQKEYERADNQFKRENLKHDKERRRELVEFVVAGKKEAETTPETASEYAVDAEVMSALQQEFLGTQSPTPAPASAPAATYFSELDASTVPFADLPALYRELEKYELELLATLDALNRRIEALEERSRLAWLAGTAAAAPAPATG